MPPPDQTATVSLQLIQNLKASLDASRAALDQFSKEGKSGFDRLAESATNAANWMAKAGVAAVLVGGTSLLALTKGAIDSADAMDELAEKTGLSVEELSTLKFVADQSDTSIEALAVGWRKLAGTIEDARSGNKEAISIFRDLGVSLNDASGKAREQRAIFDDVASAFSRYANGADKMVAAQRLFGLSGSELIPILNRGAEGIAELQDKARKLGLELDTETARKAGHFKDQVKQLQSGVTALGQAIATEALPYLTRIVDEMARGHEQGGLLQAAIRGSAQAFKEWSNFVTLGATKSEHLNEQITAMDEEVARLQQRSQALQRAAEAAADGNAGPMAWLLGVDDPAKLGAMVDQVQTELQQALDTRKSFQDDLDKLNQAPIRGTKLGGVLPSEPTNPREPNKPRLSLSDPDAGTEETKRRERYEKEFQDAVAHNDRMDQEIRTRQMQRAEEVEIEALSKEARLAVEREKELIAVGQHEEARALILKKYQQAEEKLRVNAQVGRLRDTAQMFGALGQLAEAAGGKGFAIGKKFAIAEALINTYAGATAALRTPGMTLVQRIAGVAIALATGMKQVQAIRSTSVGGGGGASAGGGGGSVGEGGGGGSLGGEPTNDRESLTNPATRPGLGANVVQKDSPTVYNIHIMGDAVDPEFMAMKLGSIIQKKAAAGMLQINVQERTGVRGGVGA